MASDDRNKASRTPTYVLDEERYKEIAGNASDEVKQYLTTALYMFMGHGRAFADSVGGRLEVTEANIQKKAEEPDKLESIVICEIDVEQDMVNGGGNIHGACSAYLIDLCSTMPILALGIASGKKGVLSVSQVINVVYHSPARIGDHLRIISTSISLGARTTSARCEIWNATHHRLVASGVQVKMDPSLPKL